MVATLLLSLFQFFVNDDSLRLRVGRRLSCRLDATTVVLLLLVQKWQLVVFVVVLHHSHRLEGRQERATRHL